MDHNTDFPNHPLRRRPRQPSSSWSAASVTARSGIDALTDGERRWWKVRRTAAMAEHQNRSSSPTKGSSDSHGPSLSEMEQRPLNILPLAAVHGGLWWLIATAERASVVRVAAGT
ncbi:unnamed protein product [Lactuca virosa]|uniref:Uncharacterized protein n=1 Tax=Lactuca virosa TaxID=75947 RepID=A0AAU9NRK1_9ASTR|nr:unnamed protein product [Lactuca virosa]